MLEKAILIDKKDNVATALRQLEAGDAVQVGIEDYSAEVRLSQAIPFGHKFALTDIEKGDPVIKYGETIGLATKPIGPGEHVHIHNVEGQKLRGDKR